MRDLPTLLAQIAATVVAGSGVIAGSGCTLGRHSSCDGYVQNEKDIAVTPDVACAIADQGGVDRNSAFNSSLFGQACSSACGAGYGECSLPPEYVKAYQSALPPAPGLGGSDAGSDAGSDTGSEAGSDAGAKTCPAVTGMVNVRCGSFPCEGRRTEGIDEPLASNDPGLGAYFAACSYLEAVSVHAFARLRVELAAHGAPEELLALAMRAEDEEIRHAELTGDLARSYGVAPEEPVAPPSAVRTLFAIALENAVEGCVRETYGAAVACFRAIRAGDPTVRAVMQTIARDECEHAELSFRIAAWVMPCLRAEERNAITLAMRHAMQQLVTSDDDLLDDEQRAISGVPGRGERVQLAHSIDREVLRSAA